jgi:hypothetical protein
MIVSLAGLVVNTLRSTEISKIRKFWVVIFSLGLLFLPFAIGLPMHGLILYRSMVSLPVVIAGVVMLGMLGSHRIFKIFVALLTVFCVFQFVMSTNHLFAASHLSLQADRSMATRLIGKIEDAQVRADVKKLRYMEVIGYHAQPPTALIPQIETLGISYFELAEGNSNRIVLFLKTLGYSGLEPLPLDQQAQWVDIANSMPIWPEEGSVLVVGDVVLVKFGPYSATQKRVICSRTENKVFLQSQEFCP